jgi:hypothetical protein
MDSSAMERPCALACPHAGEQTAGRSEPLPSLPIDGREGILERAERDGAGANLAHGLRPSLRAERRALERVLSTEAGRPWTREPIAKGHHVPRSDVRAAANPYNGCNRPRNPPDSAMPIKAETTRAMIAEARIAQSRSVHLGEFRKQTAEVSGGVRDRIGRVPAGVRPLQITGQSGPPAGSFQRSASRASAPVSWSGNATSGNKMKRALPKGVMLGLVILANALALLWSPAEMDALAPPPASVSPFPAAEQARLIAGLDTWLGAPTQSGGDARLETSGCLLVMNLLAVLVAGVIRCLRSIAAMALASQEPVPSIAACGGRRAHIAKCASSRGRKRNEGPPAAKRASSCALAPGAQPHDFTRERSVWEAYPPSARPTLGFVYTRAYTLGVYNFSALALRGLILLHADRAHEAVLHMFALNPLLRVKVVVRPLMWSPS